MPLPRSRQVSRPRPARWQAALVALGMSVLPATVPAYAAAAAPDPDPPTEIDGSDPGASGDPLTAGTYTTTLPAIDTNDDEADGRDEAHIFTIDKGANNALWVTASSQQPADPDLTGEAALALRLPGSDTTCGDPFSTTISSDAPAPRAQAALLAQAKVAGEDSDCASAEKLELYAVYGYSSESDATPPKTSPETLLSVMTEPPISQTDQLPDSSEDGSTTESETFTWRPRSSKSTPVQGSDSFANAPVIEPGLHTDTVRSGQVRAYRFRLDFGQQARVVTKFRSGRELDDPNFPEDGVEVVQSTYNPTLTPISNVAGTVTYDADDTSAGPVGEQLPTVRYANRDTISDSPPKQLSVAGYYYVLVSAPRTEPGFTLPYSLDLQIDGSPSGQPTYIGGEPSWPAGKPVPPGASPEPSTTSGAGPASAAGDGADQIDFARVGIGGGAVVLLVVIAGLLIARARRP